MLTPAGRCSGSSKAKLGTTVRHIATGGGTPCSSVSLLPSNVLPVKPSQSGVFCQCSLSKTFPIRSLLPMFFELNSQSGVCTSHSSPARFDRRHLQGHRACWGKGTFWFSTIFQRYLRAFLFWQMFHCCFFKVKDLCRRVNLGEDQKEKLRLALMTKVWKSTKSSSC